MKPKILVLTGYGINCDYETEFAFNQPTVGGDARRVLADYPDQEFVSRTLDRYFRPDGLPDGTPYRPIPKLDLHQKPDAVRLTALGAYFQVALAKEGHDGPIHYETDAWDASSATMASSTRSSCWKASSSPTARPLTPRPSSGRSIA